MPFVAAATNYMLNQWATNNALALSLHSAYSSTGANELTGGSPAYARIVPTWNSASGGSLTAASFSAAFNVPGSSTVAFIGVWNNTSGGTFQGMSANGGATQYEFTATNGSPCVFTAPNSTYSNGQTVVIYNTQAATIPTGFTVGTIYFIVGASGATFNLSATSGGAAINSSSVGGGIAQQITTEIFGAQGTFTMTSDTWSIV